VAFAKDVDQVHVAQLERLLELVLVEFASHAGDRFRGVKVEVDLSRGYGRHGCAPLIVKRQTSGVFGHRSVVCHPSSVVHAGGGCGGENVRL
jgi:hypothetical protein